MFFVFLRRAFGQYEREGKRAAELSLLNADMEKNFEAKIAEAVADSKAEVSRAQLLAKVICPHFPRQFLLMADWMRFFHELFCDPPLKLFNRREN